MGSRFVVHGPTTVDHFQPTFVDQSFDEVSGFLVLVVPPLEEKRGFDLDESSVFILVEFLNGGVEDVLNASMVNGIEF